MNLSTQYNDFAQRFSDIRREADNTGDGQVLYDLIDFIGPNIKVLDLGCGDGLDLKYYKQLGAQIFGLDASEKFVAIARSNNPDADIRQGLFENIPFEDNYFDAVLSKYAIQTSPDIAPVLSGIYRILKPGGIVLLLATHPFRQYFEKKEPGADYFEQKIVDSNILHNTILVKEPSHTLNEYLSDFLFEKFDVKFYREYWDDTAEQIEGRRYPGYFVLKAVKR